MAPGIDLAMFNDGARLPILRAQQVARAAGAASVGTGDLLAAILLTDCGASDVLRSAGLTSPTPGAVDLADVSVSYVPLSAGARKAVAGARVEATVRRHPYVTSCHLAAALVRRPDPQGRVGRSLRVAAIDAEECSDRLLDQVDAVLAG